MSTNTSLKQTPLYEAHVALGAKMVPFGGWDMPVQYEGILAEHAKTRQEAALFDISHMGEFIITGDPKKNGFDRIVTMRLDDLPVKSCRYGAMLSEQGTVLDDLIVFRMEEEKWFIVVNASTTDKDREHMLANLKDKSCFEDVSVQTGKLDLQGPASRDILKAIVRGIETLDYYGFDFFNVLGEECLVSRTGYTGELGYEIYCSSEKTEAIWNLLLKDKRVAPAGLGARDVLRLEVGYSLYGHELSEQISVLESGLERFVDFDKDFIGKDALLKQKEQGLKRQLVAFQSVSRRSPREGHQLFNEAGEVIGQVTSGSFSPIVNAGIGLGLISIDYVKKGNTIYFGSDKNKEQASIASRFFYKEGSLKK